MNPETGDFLRDADLVEADPFYIRTVSPVTDERSLVLKHGDAFVVLDQHGDIRPVVHGEEGLYHDGTRYLSGLRVRFGRQRPLLLSSGLRHDNSAIVVDLTNPDLIRDGVIDVPRGTLHLARLMVLAHGVLHDRMRLRNYGLAPVSVPIEIDFAADFVDIFEVRGTVRAERGTSKPVVVHDDGVTLEYRGLDGITRQTRIRIEGAIVEVAENRVRINCDLPPHGEVGFVVSVTCENAEPQVAVAFPSALQAVTEDLDRRRAEYCDIFTSNNEFNDWLQRSLADLSMMATDTLHGEYPYAGVPWFSCPFGRDGIITAMQCLWANPSVARGVLSFLAATQATTTDPTRDAQPGKVLHEMRSGEMATLGEIPFGHYYGSHDATPLFVMLAAAYFERTDDRAFIERIWPSIDAALTWIEQDGDLDEDGFVEYAGTAPAGLIHQGWKDSHDAVSHQNGELAAGPIALCEVQAYVYGAWRGAASLASALGQTERAASCAKQAAAMIERFDAEFWDDTMGTYVLALDGIKRPCMVRSSNAGHALFTGIAVHRRAGSVARTLMSTDMFSGWGVRTLAATEARYNPMSYHNGSIWPHDNSLIAAGLARYGFHDEAMKILSGMFDASLHLDLHRLPELFCGFPRGTGDYPVLYPVACSPQSWASGSVLLLLQSVLGLEIHAASRSVKFTRPRLPEFLREVHLRNLRVGPHSVDLLLQRHDYDVGINVVRRSGFVEVIAIK